MQKRIVHSILSNLISLFLLYHKLSILRYRFLKSKVKVRTGECRCQVEVVT